MSRSCTLLQASWNQWRLEFIGLSLTKRVWAVASKTMYNARCLERGFFFVKTTSLCKYTSAEEGEQQNLFS